MISGSSGGSEWRSRGLGVSGGEEGRCHPSIPSLSSSLGVYLDLGGFWEIFPSCCLGWEGTVGA